MAIPPQKIVGTNDKQIIEGEKTFERMESFIMLETPDSATHESRKTTWNNTLGTTNIASKFSDVTLQTGHEDHVMVYNDTGLEILNGFVVRHSGIFEEFDTIALAISNEVTGITDEIGMTTMDIPNGTFGIVAVRGKVNGVNTSTCQVDDHVFISPTIDGGITEEKPVFPNYAIAIGIVSKVGTTDGQIILQIAGRPRDTKDNIFNGSFRETIKLFVSSDGEETTASLSPGNGQPNLTMQFRSGDFILTATPDITKVLTDGTEAQPQTNYIYKLESDKLNADFQVSTSGFPNVEHIKIAVVVLKEVTATQIEGAYVNQNWNDHIQDDAINMGHLLHITERMRQDLPKWSSGTEGSLTIVGASTPDDVFFSVTSGFVYQVHKQTYPALDMQTGDDLHVLNDFTAPNKTITNINSEILDALGNTLTNRAFSFVFGGVINRTGQTSHIWLDKPIGSYQKNATATAILDPTGFSVYDVPDFFSSTAFLIGRATFSLDAAGNVWTLLDFEDLRKRPPNPTVGAGGGGGTGVTTFTGLTDTQNSYLGEANKAVVVNDVGGGDGDQLIFTDITDIALNTIHRSSDGSDHSIVVSNQDKIDNSFNMSPETYIGNVGQQDDPINSEYTIVSGTQSQDTTNKKVGSEALRITENDNTAGFLSSKKTIVYDYSVLNNGSDFVDEDYFNFIANISDVSLTQDLIFIFRTDTSNFYTITINSGLVTGHKTYSVLKSSAVATLSPDWSNITEVEIGWTSLINAINEFVVFNTFLPVIKDPSTAVANPFQRLGFAEADSSNGDWFIGFEFGEAACKQIGVSGVDADASLIFNNSYDDGVFVVKALTDDANLKRGLTYFVDQSNLVFVSIESDSLRIRVKESASNIDTTTPYPVDRADIINFKMTKEGNSLLVEISKNAGSDRISLTATTNLNGGSLAIGATGARFSKIFNASATGIPHAHHSDVAEVAKTIQVKTNNGAFIADELNYGEFGLDTSNNRLYMKFSSTEVIYFAGTVV